MGKGDNFGEEGKRGKMRVLAKKKATIACERIAMK
jgi:hypothetical protein